jgi:hypothetical protein
MRPSVGAIDCGSRRRPITRAKQFNAALEALGIDNRVAAANILGIGRRSVIRYAQGEADVPVIVQRLLRLLRLLQRHGIPKDFTA